MTNENQREVENPCEAEATYANGDASNPSEKDEQTPINNPTTEELRTPLGSGIPQTYLNTVKIKSLQEPVTIVTVSSKDAWPSARDMKFIASIQYNGRQTEFKLTGISDSEWLFIQDKNMLPVAEKEEDEKEPDFIKLHADRLDRRKVSLFECALKEKVPGNTEEEKVHWLRSQCTISIQNLYDIIQSVSLGLGSNDIEANYQMHLREDPNIAVFSGFTKLSEIPTYDFIRGRIGQDYLSVFAMNAITESVKIEIEDSNRLSPPPTKPSRLADGSLDYQNPEPWYDEPMYKLKSDKVKAAKSIAYISHCLPFDLPNDEWLEDRLVGDVLRMKLFIQQELLDPTIRTTFF